jgi:hypothetical protein
MSENQRYTAVFRNPNTKEIVREIIETETPYEKHHYDDYRKLVQNDTWFPINPFLIVIK